jgi:hypothetical protein
MRWGIGTDVTPNRCTLVAIGADRDELIAVAQGMELDDDVIVTEVDEYASVGDRVWRLDSEV